MQPTVALWLFYATTTVCPLPIVMSLNRVLPLVCNEINMKRKNNGRCVCSIPLGPKYSLLGMFGEILAHQL